MEQLSDFQLIIAYISFNIKNNIASDWKLIFSLKYQNFDIDINFASIRDDFPILEISFELYIQTIQKHELSAKLELSKRSSFVLKIK